MNAIALAFGDHDTACTHPRPQCHAGKFSPRRPSLFRWFTTPWSVTGEPAADLQRRTALARLRRTQWPAHREPWRDLPWVDEDEDELDPPR